MRKRRTAVHHRLRSACVALAAAVALGASVACGGDARPAATATPTADVLRITNETPCVLHIRFDNGAPFGRALPGVTTEFTVEGLAAYRFVKAESTMAIFRTYNMEQVRQDGYTLVVRPALDDHPCVEQP
ncbi:MAG: hypothetical protein HY874_11705 [Chloroflexi bacterium]|nr:hypothetical protein [Chloroflexota bacterium]